MDIMLAQHYSIKPMQTYAKFQQVTIYMYLLVAHFPNDNLF